MTREEDVNYNVGRIVSTLNDMNKSLQSLIADYLYLTIHVSMLIAYIKQVLDNAVPSNPEETA